MITSKKILAYIISRLSYIERGWVRGNPEACFDEVHELLEWARRHKRQLELEEDAKEGLKCENVIDVHLGGHVIRIEIDPTMPQDEFYLRADTVTSTTTGADE